MPSIGRILVTGSGGFVGRHLVPRLEAAFGPASVIRFAADLADPAAIDDAVAGTRPDACVHLAGIASNGAARGNPEAAWRINLSGSLALASSMRRHAPDAVLVFAGSADAYGASFRAGAPLDETAALAPQNTYAATKAATDLALGALAAEGARIVRLRPFNHTGPGQSADYAVPAFARQAARIAAGRQAAVMKVGALAPMRDFLDVRDVCEAYVAAIARGHDLERGAIFNIASGTARRIGDVLDAILAATGIEAEIETGAALLRPTDIAVACGDASAARATLGWTPRISWDQTIADVVADWRGRVAAEPPG